MTDTRVSFSIWPNLKTVSQVLGYTFQINLVLFSLQVSVWKVWAIRWILVWFWCTCKKISVHGIIRFFSKNENYIGLTSSIADWFESYMSNKNCFVSLKNTFPSSGTFLHGVLPWLMLGILFFVICRNDFQQPLEKTGSNSYRNATYIF